jgi:hypothetical protein
MTFRAIAAAATAATTVFVLASPAWAHEEINPKVVATGAPVFLSLTAANEASADLTKIVLTAPRGIAFGEATRSPAGWTADHTATTLTWSGGKIAPETFETFGFELDNVPQPGTLAFGVALTAGSNTEQVTVNITAAAGGGASVPTTATTAASGSTTTVATAPVPPATIPASVAKSIDKADDKATTATILAAVAIGLAVIGIVLAIALRGARRRAGAPGAPGASAAPAAPAAPVDQDF